MRKLLIIILSVCFILQPIISQASMLFSSGGQQVVYRGTVTGLRISSADGVAFLDNIDITAEEANGKVVASGSVTQANMRISGVDGTAFIDTADATFATNITGHLGKYLVIKDSTGKAIKGWIKAAGSGETLGSEILDDVTFDDDSKWTKGAGWTVSGGKGVATSSAVTSIYQAKNVVINALYKHTGDLVVTVGSFAFRMSGINGVFRTTSGSYVDYISNDTSTTASNISTISSLTVASTGTVDNRSVKQVLTPSNLGVTITNTKNGATYNWYSKETGFNYNDSSNYTYQVIDRSLSAFADGNYGIEVYDSSGRMLKGVAKAVGTEETLGSELLTGWTNSDFDTFTSSGKDVTSAIYSTSGDQNAYTNNFTVVKYNLYKFVDDRTQTSGQNTRTQFVSGNGSDANYGITNYGSGVFTLYYTEKYGGTSAKFDKYNTSASNWSGIFSTKQVLTPSTSGVTIVSAKGGTTYNWQFKHASFTYNQSTNYVILKKLR